MKSKEIRHYFVSSEHSEDEFFNFNYELKDKKFRFTSSPDIFSKNQVDAGSEILIKAIMEKFDSFDGEILDICCGYGTIGIILSKFYDSNFDLCDINTLAVKLAGINIKNNNCDKLNVFESNLFENVTKKYNHIVSNPPIKVGKSVLLNLINSAKDYLVDGGDITIVIKKNLGADSTKKYLKEIFGNCEVLDREKGYYILYSKKI